MATYTTYEAAATAYLANTDYDDGAGSVTKARAFRGACRALLVLKPSSAADGGQSHSFDMGLVKEQLAGVGSWIAANDTSQSNGQAQVRTVDFRWGRS